MDLKERVKESIERKIELMRVYWNLILYLTLYVG